MRPRTTEDLEALQVRARVRLERRRGGAHTFTRGMHDVDCAACPVGGFTLVREAAALVAALDAALDENMQRLEYGDR